MRISAILLSSLLAGIAAAEQPPHEGHGPRGHRFENAETFAKRFDDPGRLAYLKPAEIVKHLAARPGMTVVDVGAGTGTFERHLSRAVGKMGRVLALDIEPDMIRYLGERVQREKLGNVEPRLVKHDDPQLEAGSADRVVIIDTWHHISDRPAYARKLAAALAPGGRIMIVDFTMESPSGPPRSERLTPEQVVGELEAGGLTARVVKESLPRHYIVIGAAPASE